MMRMGKPKNSIAVRKGRLTQKSNGGERLAASGRQGKNSPRSWKGLGFIPLLKLAQSPRLVNGWSFRSRLYASLNEIVFAIERAVRIVAHLVFLHAWRHTDQRISLSMPGSRSQAAAAKNSRCEANWAFGP